LVWYAVAGTLLAVALASEFGFDSLLLTRFQIESVPLYFLDDVLLQNFALEAPERVLQSFTILNVDFGQRSPPYSLKKEILHANSSTCGGVTCRGGIERDLALPSRSAYFSGGGEGVLFPDAPPDSPTLRI
jgi:hypothetical protein